MLTNHKFPLVIYTISGFIGMLLFLFSFMLSPATVFVDNNSTIITEEYRNLTPLFNRSVMLVIDSMRQDEVDPSPSESAPELSHKLSAAFGVAKRNPVYVTNFTADPPTTTMQRMSAITSGTVPSYFSQTENIMSVGEEKSMVFDSIIRQLDGQTVFAGDKTWRAIFLEDELFARCWTPERTITNHYNYYDTDNKIDAFVNEELEKDDWKLLATHYLGLDNIAHANTRTHPLILEKLRVQGKFMDSVIARIQNDTIMFIYGDHGSTDGGSHSEGNFQEVAAGIIVYANGHEFLKPRRDFVQVDFAATFSGLLGLPIPYASIGKMNLDLFVDYLGASDEYVFAIVNENLRQVRRLFLNYPNEEMGREMLDLLDRYEGLVIDKETHRVDREMYYALFDQMHAFFLKNHTRYNYSLLIKGSILLLLSAAGAMTAAVFSRKQIEFVSRDKAQISAVLALGVVLDVLLNFIPISFAAGASVWVFNKVYHSVPSVPKFLKENTVLLLALGIRLFHGLQIFSVTLIKLEYLTVAIYFSILAYLLIKYFIKDSQLRTYAAVFNAVMVVILYGLELKSYETRKVSFGNFILRYFEHHKMTGVVFSVFLDVLVTAIMSYLMYGNLRAVFDVRARWIRVGHMVFLPFLLAFLSLIFHVHLIPQLLYLLTVVNVIYIIYEYREKQPRERVNAAYLDILAIIISLGACLEVSGFSMLTTGILYSINIKLLLKALGGTHQQEHVVIGSKVAASDNTDILKDIIEDEFKEGEEEHDQNPSFEGENGADFISIPQNRNILRIRDFEITKVILITLYINELGRIIFFAGDHQPFMNTINTNSGFVGFENFNPIQNIIWVLYDTCLFVFFSVLGLMALLANTNESVTNPLNHFIKGAEVLMAVMLFDLAVNVAVTSLLCKTEIVFTFLTPIMLFSFLSLAYYAMLLFSAYLWLSYGVSPAKMKSMFRTDN